MVSGSNNTSVKYHNIFDYKLSKDEAVKWQHKSQKVAVSGKRTKSQIQRAKYSQRKLIIAKKAARVISIIPSVLFVGVTGSLAMMNANKNSDIDLLIITKKNTLWTTRALVYFVLRTTHFVLRKPQDKNERDALCLNLWLDETSLIWQKKQRNIYTAHEIAQIVPLANKENIYERFLYLNKWILDYWPNAVAVQSTKRLHHTVGIVQKKLRTKYYVLSTFIEKIAYLIQYIYMKSKITNEVITPTRALFHPNNNSKYVLDKLKVVE